MYYFHQGSSYRKFYPLPIAMNVSNSLIYALHEKALYVPIILSALSRYTLVSIYARLCNLSRFHIAGTVSQVNVPDPGANFIPFYYPIKSAVVRATLRCQDETVFPVPLRKSHH